MTANPMTHPSPEAVEANTNWAMMIASHLTHIPAGDRSQRERALVFLSEAVTALTTQLEAERARSSQPIKMILFCPACGEQHVDELDERTPGWENPPHRSHLCHACGHIWRPADVATEGVRAIETVGKADKPLATSLTTRLSAETARADAAVAEAKAAIGELERLPGVRAMRELERAVEDFIDKIVGVAQAVAFQSDCDATELVGQMISVLNGRRHDIERFMREGSELWLDGTFMPENGTLSYRAANGKIMTPDKLRTELFVTGNKRAFPLPPPPKDDRHGD